MMSVSGNNRGGITVFQCLIFTSLLVFIGMILDIVRIAEAERKVQSALNTSARSVLACYNEDLTGDYGLFGLDTGSKESKAGKMFDKYLDINMKEGKQGFNLVNYKITSDGAKLESFGNMLNNKVYKEQIIKYMKYRAPISVTGKIIEKFNDSGLLQKLKFSKAERQVRIHRKEIKQKVDNINDSLRAIKGFENKGAEELEEVAKRLKSSGTLLSGLDATLKKYSESKSASDKSADESGAASTGTGFVNITDEARELRRVVSSNADKVRNALEAADGVRRQVNSLQNRVDGLDDSDDSKEEKAKLQELIDRKKVEMIDLRKNLKLDEMREIKLDEAADDGTKPDEGDARKNTGEFLNRIKTELKTYLVDINPEWLISEQAAKKALLNDETGYGDMRTGNISGDISEEAAERKNDGILAFVEKLLDMIKDVAQSGMEKIYLVEYILDRYTYVTSKAVRGHYFQKGEVEYILCGKNSQLANIEEMMARISFMRFAINTVDYFATGKTPHPVLRLVYAVTRGFIQSCRDVYELYDGKEVSICPSLNNRSLSFKLNYTDHLRIFLLLQPEDALLDNMRQLVQVNMKQVKPGFRLKDYNTVLHARTVVDINLWFLPLLGFDRLGIKGFSKGKYSIEKEIYVGY